MIKPNLPSMSSQPLPSISETGRSSAPSTAAHQSFKAILSALNANPMKPLGLQRYAGAASRNLAQQINTDTQKPV